jgi:hypothetical protein
MLLAVCIVPVFSQVSPMVPYFMLGCHVEDSHAYYSYSSFGKQRSCWIENLGMLILLI